MGEKIFDLPSLHPSKTSIPSVITSSSSSFFFSSFTRKSSRLLPSLSLSISLRWHFSPREKLVREKQRDSDTRPARGRGDYRKVSGGEVSIRVTHTSLDFVTFSSLRGPIPSRYSTLSALLTVGRKGGTPPLQWLWRNFEVAARGNGRVRFRVSQDYESLPRPTWEKWPREIARRRESNWKKELRGNRSDSFSTVN